MDIAFPRKRFTGCEFLAPLDSGGVYLTDAELTLDGLMVLCRHLDADGRVIKPLPPSGPILAPSALMGVKLAVMLNGEVLAPTIRGELGSLWEGAALSWFKEVPFVEQPAVAVSVHGHKTIASVLLT